MLLAPQQPPLLILLLLFFLLAAAPARAEEPLWGEIASTLGKGFVNVSSFGSVRSFKPYRHHGGLVSLRIDRTDLGASVEYGLRPDLDLHLRIPYFHQTIEESFAGQSVENPMSGLGEIRVGGKWRFRQEFSAGRKDELALIMDVKLPTGSTELRDAGGALITPHLQPNSGNWGAGLGLAADRHTRQGGYWTSGMFSAETVSSRYHRGWMLELHASAGWRLRPLKQVEQTDWMGIAGLHFHQMGKDKELGQTLGDSGGNILRAELGLVGAKRTKGARLGILVPLHTNLGLSHAPPRYEIQVSLRASV
jgi:hypothetical protein